MRNVKELSEFITTHYKTIITELDPYDITLYIQLREQLYLSDIRSNLLFREAFANYYFNTPGLSMEFKNNYFHALEDLKKDSSYTNLEYLLNRFFKINNRIELSYSTKLINIINPDYPLYDSNINKILGLPDFYSPDKDERISKCLSLMNSINNTYLTLISNNLIDSALNLFDKQFDSASISTVKKIDFILWQSAKL